MENSLSWLFSVIMIRQFNSHFWSNWELMAETLHSWEFGWCRPKSFLIRHKAVKGVNLSCHHPLKFVRLFSKSTDKTYQPYKGRNKTKSTLCTISTTESTFYFVPLKDAGTHKTKLLHDKLSLFVWFYDAGRV